MCFVKRICLFLLHCYYFTSSANFVIDVVRQKFPKDVENAVSEAFGGANQYRSEMTQKHPEAAKQTGESESVCQ